MSEKTIPIKGAAYAFTVCLADQSNPLVYKSSPTLADGDVKVDIDGGGLNNITTLPVATGKLVAVSLSATEMNADEVTVIFSDASGSEWCDLVVVLHPSNATIGDLITLGTGGTSKTYTLTDGSSNPIPDVDVWVSTDTAGSAIVANGRTDVLGQVTFMLDSGVTYYIWRQKSGWNFTNPDTEVA